MVKTTHWKGILVYKEVTFGSSAGKPAGCLLKIQRIQSEELNHLMQIM